MVELICFVSLLDQLRNSIISVFFKDDFLKIFIIILIRSGSTSLKQSTKDNEREMSSLAALMEGIIFLSIVFFCIHLRSSFN